MRQLMTHTTLGGILIFVGTAIGAGMLALPMITSEIGFYYAILVFILGYVFMTLCSYLFAEANFYSTLLGANIITLARERLGVVGKASAWIFFLLLLYAVAAAYISAGGALMGKLLQSYISVEMPLWIGMGIFFMVFGFIVVFGMRSIDVVNRLLLLGLMAAFVYLIFTITPQINPQNFTDGDPVFIWAILPVVILSFTSSIIIPSVKTYLHDDAKKLLRVIWIGNLIPLIFYILWQIMIMGVLPMEGENSLAMIEHSAHPVNVLTQTLRTVLGVPGISIAVGIFSFTALVTSFLAVSISLVDFLADGFQIKKDLNGRIYLALIAMVPPLLFALFFPKGFIFALGYGGVFVAILYGILPVLMVWKARYHQKLVGPIRVWGGKFLLVTIMACSILVIIVQIGATLGILPM